MGCVEAIWTAPEGSADMERHTEVAALADRGLSGDRYATGRGHYSGFDECQVTVLASEALAEIQKRFGIDLSDGRHRRNVVVSGVDLDALLGLRFYAGNAVFEGTRPRPPCRHLEELASEEGVARALAGGRAGICADVVEGGTVGVGDTVERLPESQTSDEIAAAIRDRHAEE